MTGVARGESSDERIREEALRVYRRYQLEIVEALGLCPWAERARNENKVRERVVLCRELDQEASLDEVGALADDPNVEIGLLLFPRLSTPRTDFERFVSELSAADAARRELGHAPFAMAAFHPDARADLSDGERLIPFLRRTPDPTIQLVRHEALERVRDGFNEGTHFVDIRTIATVGISADDTRPLRERIARSNLRAVQRVGPSEVERRLDAIRADRDVAYAKWAPS